MYSEMLVKFLLIWKLAKNSSYRLRSQPPQSPCISVHHRFLNNIKNLYFFSIVLWVNFQDFDFFCGSLYMPPEKLWWKLVSREAKTINVCFALFFPSVWVGIYVTDTSGGAVLMQKQTKKLSRQ